MTTLEFAAKCNSRETSSDELECAEKISTITLLCEMAFAMAVGQFSPGATSLGAIQQRRPALSRLAQIASATGLSLLECEINMSWAMGFAVRDAQVNNNQFQKHQYIVYGSKP